MILLEGMAGSQVAFEHRDVKPLYGRVQATPQTRRFAEGADLAAVPGLAATGYPVEVAGASDAPNGMFGSYGKMGYVEDGIDATVWVLGPDAAVAVARRALADSAWDAAKAAMGAGETLFVGADAEGRLSLEPAAPLFRLLDVQDRCIVVGGMPRNAAQVSSSQEVPEGQAIDKGESAPDEHVFANRPVSDIQDGVEVQGPVGRGMSVTGTLKNVEWPDFGDPADVPHHYIALQYTGTKGQALVRRYEYGTGKVHVFGETNDTDTTMILVSFLPDSDDALVYDSYASREDAESNTNPVRYVIDCSKLVRA